MEVRPGWLTPLLRGAGLGVVESSQSTTRVLVDKHGVLCGVRGSKGVVECLGTRTKRGVARCPRRRLGCRSGFAGAQERRALSSWGMSFVRTSSMI